MRVKVTKQTSINRIEIYEIYEIYNLNYTESSIDIN
jgi:hypothetical protein